MGNHTYNGYLKMIFVKNCILIEIGLTALYINCICRQIWHFELFKDSIINSMTGFNIMIPGNRSIILHIIHYPAEKMHRIITAYLNSIGQIKKTGGHITLQHIPQI